MNMTNFDFILPPSGGKALRGFPVEKIFRQSVYFLLRTIDKPILAALRRSRVESGPVPPIPEYYNLSGLFSA